MGFLRGAVGVALLLSVTGCAVSKQSNVSPDSQQNEAESEQLSFLPLVEPTDGGLGVGLARFGDITTVRIETGQPEAAFEIVAAENSSDIILKVQGAKPAQSESFEVEDTYIKSLRLKEEKEGTTVAVAIVGEHGEHIFSNHELHADGGDILLTFSGIPRKVDGLAEQSIEEEQQVASLEAKPAGKTPEAPTAVIEPGQEKKSLAQKTNELLVQEIKKVNEDLHAEFEQPYLDILSLEKEGEEPGTVRMTLADRVAFQLKQTAPSEYVLKIPGIKAKASTKFAQIADVGTPGVRSVRAVETKDGVDVRMFIDAGTELVAVPQGNEIVVKSKKEAQKAFARGQLAEPEAEEGESPPEAPSASPFESPSVTPSDDFIAEGVASADGSKVYRGRLISLDLQDTDIDNALRIIAEVSNLNIIASEEVSGKVTLRLIDVPWDQALDVILKTNGLDQVSEGNVIRIAPVEKLRAEREALREAKRAAEELEDLQVRYLRVSYARVDELIEQVETVLSERGTVTADERTNQLIVKDIAKGHRDVLGLVQRLDLRTPQVLLETQVVEAQRNILRDLGFQWNFQYVGTPETGNATGMNFPNSVTVGGGTTDGASNQLVNFPAVIDEAAGTAISALLESADGSRTLSARLSALESEGQVRVVSRPQVATVNNREAQIKSVETVRVRLPDSGTSVATGAGAAASGGGSSAFEEIDVGIELRVTPQASPDYFVLLDIFAKSSTFGGREVDNIPSTLEREATSTILVKSGQTFALGGVYRIEDRDTVQGVPWLKDLPVLGHFFRRTLVDKKDEELIFFITPHIVEGSFDPSLM